MAVSGLIDAVTSAEILCINTSGASSSAKAEGIARAQANAQIMQRAALTGSSIADTSRRAARSPSRRAARALPRGKGPGCARSAEDFSIALLRGGDEVVVVRPDVFFGRRGAGARVVGAFLDVGQSAIELGLLVRGRDFGGEHGGGKHGKRDCGDDAFHDQFPSVVGWVGLQMQFDGRAQRPYFHS